MNFLRAFYITGATTVFVTLIGFLNNIVLTRYLGPEGRGQYSILINLMTLLYLLFGEGIRRTNTIIIGNDKNQLNYTLLLSIKYFILVSILFLIAYYFNPLWIDLLPNINIKLILITLMASAATILWRSLQSIFLGYKLIGDYNILQLFYTSAVFLINLVIIYILNLDLFAIVWNLVIISLIIIFIGVWKLKKILTEKSHTKNQSENKTISLAVKATVASIAMFMFLKGDLFIVNYFLDASITGIYSISLVFVDLLQKLPLVLGPLILAKSANKEFSANLDEFARLFRILLVFNFTGCSVFILIW
ncbi:MAG: oligosaccharide flippase family protein [Melioribacteraceae bacterium]|nr:oligosaccharide flippase family protein [Melioribacteraceae bacterium]